MNNQIPQDARKPLMRSSRREVTGLTLAAAGYSNNKVRLILHGNIKARGWGRSTRCTDRKRSMVGLHTRHQVVDEATTLPSTKASGPRNQSFARGRHRQAPRACHALCVPQHDTCTINVNVPLALVVTAKNMSAHFISCAAATTYPVEA